MKTTPATEKVTLEAIGELIERSFAILPTRDEMKREINIATSKLATKDEIAKLATKDEMNGAISKLATKEEMNDAISKLATKGEMAKLATKDDILEINDRFGLMDKRFDAIDDKLLEFTGRFDSLERKVERMNDNFTNQLDYFHLYCPTRTEFDELDGRMRKAEKKLKI